ncbi:MAG: hypothetical protein CM15mP119_1270 [Alphaproteobacteria bacterium]|nr:MAG: hypothetical protein CM15mP119_1270 [Alphaproteobacteria bacterium]
MTVKTSELNTQAVLAMKGAGYYSARTAGAKHAIDKVRPMPKMHCSPTRAGSFTAS